MSFLIIIAEYHNGNKYYEEYHCHLGHTDVIPYNYGYPTYLLGGYVRAIPTCNIMKSIIVT